MDKIRNKIIKGEVSLGIELGSTRIKAVLIDQDAKVLEESIFEWESFYQNGYWTYKLEDSIKGLQEVYRSLKTKIDKKYKIKIKKLNSIGISAMMHGLLAFDKDMNLLTPFRTWRNTNTEEASSYLTNLFEFNIPHRYSIAHFYQSILDKEDYVSKVKFITTLSGYIHYLLTGKKVLGIDDASGMFPVDNNKGYKKDFVDKFNKIEEVNKLNIKIEDLLPKILIGGDKGGELTEVGAKLLDPDLDLEAGVFMAPPEGDVATGMVSTNSISSRKGSISIGTSIFSMIVLEKDLKKFYREVDLVASPDGKPVAMIHCNNGTTYFDMWLNLFKEVLACSGASISYENFYEFIYKKALEADEDVGSLVLYNYLSGEPINNLLKARPLVISKEESKLNLSNFVLANLYSILATIRVGQDMLTQKEGVVIDEIVGHGGVFKTKDIMQKIVATALDTNICVYDLADKGGAWGIGVLSLYAKNKKDKQSLEEFLQKIFEKEDSRLIQSPDENLKISFNNFLKRYKNLLPIQEEIVKRY